MDESPNSGKQVCIRSICTAVLKEFCCGCVDNNFHFSCVQFSKPFLCIQAFQLKKRFNRPNIENANVKTSIFPHSETNPDVTVENVLREHISIKMVGQHSDVDVCKNINVRRNHVFEDGINKMARSKFEPLRPLSVKFADEMGASEGAVDLGGPTREFLPLAIQEAFSMNAFRDRS